MTTHVFVLFLLRDDLAAFSTCAKLTHQMVLSSTSHCLLHLSFSKHHGATALFVVTMQISNFEHESHTILRYVCVIYSVSMDHVLDS